MRRAALPLVVLLVAALAAGARLTWVRAFEFHHPQAARPVIDEASYDAWARELAAGDWLGDEVFFQEPLYPYVLGASYAVFGADLAVARRLNVALGALFAALVALVAARVVGGQRAPDGGGAGPQALAAALLAGLGAALASPLVHGAALVLKPPLFLALLAALAWVLLSSRERPTLARLGAVGALGGLAALVRGNALLLLPALCLWPALRARSLAPASLRHCALIAAGAALVLLPVAARNLHVGGVFTPTTSGAGTNLHVGNHPQNPWGSATELPFVRGVPDHEAGDWEREAERRLTAARGAPVDLDPGDVSAFWLGETLRSFVARPGVHLAILGRKLRLALHRGEVADNHDLGWDAARVAEGGGGPLPAAGGWLPWGVLGLAGALLVLRPRWSLRAALGDLGAARELAALLGLYLATLVLTVVVGRMRQPLFAFALPLAPVAPLALAAAWRARDARGAALAAAALAAVLLAAVLPARPADLVRRDRAERDFNLAVQHLEYGEPEACLALARPLLDERPGPRVRALLAEALWVQGRDARAAGDEERARLLFGAARDVLVDETRGGPPEGARERFRASALDGRISLALGDAGAASRALEDALAFDPGDVSLTLDLLRGRAQLAVERPAGSEELELLRGRAARLAQSPGLAESLRSPARLLWAELEWRTGAALGGAAGEVRVVDALKVLQGTLAALDEDDLAGAATRVLAARIQRSLGNEAAARRLVAPVLERWPGHAGARAALGDG